MINMLFFNKKTVLKPMRFWLVGASQGIGKSLAQSLLAEGHKVILSSRHATDDLQELAQYYPNTAKLMDIDVIDESSLAIACQQAWKLFDGLDYWFYNVAIYEQSSILSSQSQLQCYQKIMAINYQGFITMAHMLLPYFQQQNHGRWLVNGSISAHFGLPMGGAYSASKAALLNACQSLQPELNNLGITLQIINHGFVSTRLTEKNDFTMPFLLSAEQAAKRIKQFMLAPGKRFELKFPWQMSVLFALLNLLPYRLILMITAKLLPKTNRTNKSTSRDADSTNTNISK